MSKTDEVGESVRLGLDARCAKRRHFVEEGVQTAAERRVSPEEGVMRSDVNAPCLLVLGPSGARAKFGAAQP